jgi:SAM-dependent methyltransferase
MDKAVKNKWDERYAKVSQETKAAEVLLNNMHLLPNQGEALDLACGLGANALHLAKHGLSTSAWDISSVALERLRLQSSQLGLPLITLLCDVSVSPPKPNSFDVIVVSRFLDRCIIASLRAALKTNGVLFYQTFTQERIDNNGPKNPHFLLAQGELLQLFKDMRVLSFRDESLQGDQTCGLRNESWIIVKNEGNR